MGTMKDQPQNAKPLTYGTPPRITLLNGALGGAAGNTARALNHLVKELSSHAQIRLLHLADASGPVTAQILAETDGFVFASGVYWDSWGSPLQRFLEQSTAFEATDLWLGKPAAVLITLHSVGGKGVLSRLQGVLSTLGLWLPPMSGMVYSLANHLALGLGGSENRAAAPGGQDADLWQLGDLAVIARNLRTALDLRAREAPRWEPWPVDDGDPARIWLE